MTNSNSKETLKYGKQYNKHSAGKTFINIDCVYIVNKDNLKIWLSIYTELKAFNVPLW